MHFDRWSEQMRAAGGYVEITVRRVRRNGKRNVGAGQVQLTVPDDDRRLFDVIGRLVVGEVFGIPPKQVAAAVNAL